MRNDKHLAIELRKKGLSYNKISKELSIPKSTLVGWFSGLEWSLNIKKELERKARYNAKRRLLIYVRAKQEEWERWRESAREEARKEFDSLVNKPLFIAGLMLYWGEGDSKPKNPFRFTNTDSRMVALYINFLKEILKIPKETIRATIILYPDLSESECLGFWSEIIGIPTSQFYKTQYIKGKHPTKRLSYGICSINCGNRQLKEKILVWIDLLSKHLRK